MGAKTGLHECKTSYMAWIGGLGYLSKMLELKLSLVQWLLCDLGDSDFMWQSRYEHTYFGVMN